MNSTKRHSNSALLNLWANKYRSILTRYFQKRVPSHVDLDDLVQEVFTRLSQQADLSSVENVEGYLFRCASSVVIDFRRRSTVRARDLHDSFEESLHDSGNISLERVLVGKEAVNHLIQSLGELPEKTRHIFVLYHFENFRYRDIAHKLNIGTATVERHMSKANAFLMKQMESFK